MLKNTKSNQWLVIFLEKWSFRQLFEKIFFPPLTNCLNENAVWQSEKFFTFAFCVFVISSYIKFNKYPESGRMRHDPAFGPLFPISWISKRDKNQRDWRFSSSAGAAPSRVARDLNEKRARAAPRPRQAAGSLRQLPVSRGPRRRMYARRTIRPVANWRLKRRT